MTWRDTGTLPRSACVAHRRRGCSQLKPLPPYTTVYLCQVTRTYRCDLLLTVLTLAKLTIAQRFLQRNQQQKHREHENGSDLQAQERGSHRQRHEIKTKTAQSNLSKVHPKQPQPSPSLATEIYHHLHLRSVHCALV